MTFNYNRQLTDWARIVETFGYRDVQLKFIDDGDFIGEPYSLERPDGDDVSVQSAGRRGHLLPGGAARDVEPKPARCSTPSLSAGRTSATTGSLAADFIYTDEDLFGFPDISYVNPVIPDRSVWQHDEASRVYNLGITGLFGQYIVEPDSTRRA